MQTPLRVSSTTKAQLSTLGGEKVRNHPMPSRSALTEEDEQAVLDVLRYYRNKGQDPGYQGYFEELYTDAFVKYMGRGGYADAVCSGTAALFIALAALRLPEGSHVIVSPVTDPGTLNAIILNRLVPIVADSMPDSFNMGSEQFEARITKETRAVMVVHLGGKPAAIQEICKIADRCGISVIEDCSQAHGATVDGQKVGTFGRISAFSTMYRKAHISGGCGGVIFTKDAALFAMVRSFSDRGKPFHFPDFNEKEPGSFLFPALNLNIDEISCAIGISSLAKLDATISKRIAFLQQLDLVLAKKSKICRLSPVSSGDSPFFQPIIVDIERISCTKTEFAKAAREEGIDVNPDYRYLAAEWGWLHKYLSDDYRCINANRFRNTSFNLLFNENYGANEAHDICAAIAKVEDYFAR